MKRRYQFSPKWHIWGEGEGWKDAHAFMILLLLNLVTILSVFALNIVCLFSYFIKLISWDFFNTNAEHRTGRKSDLYRVLPCAQLWYVWYPCYLIIFSVIYIARCNQSVIRLIVLYPYVRHYDILFSNKQEIYKIFHYYWKLNLKLRYRLRFFYTHTLPYGTIFTQILSFIYLTLTLLHTSKSQECDCIVYILLLLTK
jgi:hypothetical protein